MLTQSPLPTSIESTPFYVSDHGKQNLFCDWIPHSEIWQMCPKCYENSHSCCKEAASITEEKDSVDYSCLLGFPRSPHPPIISTMSEISVPNLVYSRRKPQENSTSFFSVLTNAIARRSGEDCLSVNVFDGPSVAVSDNNVISEEEHKAEAVQEPPMRPLICSGAEYSRSLCFERSHHPLTVHPMSECSAPSFVYGRRTLQGNSVSFLSAITKRGREDNISVISSDGPSTDFKEQCVICQHEHETGPVRAVLMPPPPFNRDDSSCPLSLPSSQLPTISTLSETAAPNLVYTRRKLQQKRNGEDCLSVISSDGPLIVVEDPHIANQNRNESIIVGAPLMSPLVCNGEHHVSKSGSSCGCSLVEELGSDRTLKNVRPRIIEVDSINDSCSSSKSNMELVSASAKTAGDDNAECSSSSVMAGEDQSEKDQCISRSRRREDFEGVWPGRTRASAKRASDSSGNSSSRSCRICSRTESAVKMLICDNCEDAFHVSCCNPHLKTIPNDEWFCRSCLKKRRNPNGTISRKPLNIIGDMSRCRNVSSESESNPIALMLRDIEPYRTGVRVGKGFQVEVPDWSGPFNNDVDTIGEPLVLEPSNFVSLHELKSSKPSKFNCVGNWLQCRAVIYGAGEGDNGTICGKWRRAPLFEVQTDDWECFCCVFWDPVHADCAAPQELETDEVMKQLKCLEVLRPRMAAKRRKFERTKNGDSVDDRS